MTTPDPRPRSIAVEKFGRLALAILLSAGAHVLFVELLPETVKPYRQQVSLASAGTLTVSLIPAAVRETVRVPIVIPSLPEKPGKPLRQVDPHLSVVPLQPDVRADIPDANTFSPPEGTALPLLDYFFTSREVDSPATAVGDALLIYPREALQSRLSGEVKLRLFIDESGALVRSEVVSAQPAGIFEEAAEQAVRTMSFIPARKAGQAVPSQRSVSITFDPQPGASKEPEIRP